MLVWMRKLRSRIFKNEKVDTRHLATSVNADLILKEKRKDKVLKEKDHVNILGQLRADKS